MKLCLVTYATDHTHPGFLTLAKSAEKFGWDFVPLGDGDRWQGFKSKLTGVRDAIPGLRARGYTHLVFTDAYDSVVAGPSDVFRVAWDDGTLDGLFSCEVACWPDPSTAARWGERPPNWPWWYLNSGGYFFELGALENCLVGCDAATDDQLFFQDRYFEVSKYRPVRLDQQCRCFQSLAHTYGAPWQPPREATFGFLNGLPWNKVSKTRPVIWHGNGGTDYRWLAEGLGL